MQVTLLPPPNLFLHAAGVCGHSCWWSKLVRKLIWAKNNLFARFSIQINCLIYFAAEQALQIKNLLLKAWLVAHLCWTLWLGRGTCYAQTFLPWVAAVASSTTLCTSLAGCLWGRKELCHGFSGHGLLAVMEDGFYNNSRASCSHNLEEITSPTA